MKIILIIEDDREIRETLQSFLELEGYHVITAGDGKQGLQEAIVAKHPSLIILDLFMPRMSGLEFLKKYSKMEEHGPVLLCSACPSDHEEFLEAKHYTDFSMSKPLDINKILDLARQYCQ